jgi:hypothetical protein
MAIKKLIDNQFADVDTSDIEANVERGAALLDEKVPGWAAKVNSGILDGMFDMSKWEHCVCGQLELLKIATVVIHGEEVERSVISFNGEAISRYIRNDANSIVALGFALSEDDSDEDTYLPMSVRYQKLEELWRLEVAKRL